MGVGSCMLFHGYIVYYVVAGQGICTLGGSKCKQVVMRVVCCPIFCY